MGGAGKGPVWIASYMKSGNTWMRLMLMHLLKPQQDWKPNQAITVGTGPMPRVNIERDSLLDTSLLTADEQDLLRPRLFEAEVRAEAERCFFKTHDAYRFNCEGRPIHGESEGQAALYLVRDPRDVALSLASFWGWSIDRTVAFMNDPEADLQGIPKHFSQQIFQKPLDWSSHASSWLDQTGIPTLLIRYEDLRASPILWLSRAAEFLELRIAHADVVRAVDLTDFARLKREEEVHGFVERFRPDTTFFRHGRPGEGRKLLDPGLRETIDRAHGTLMQRLHYPCEHGIATSA